MTPIRTMLAVFAVGTSLFRPALADPGYGTYAWPVDGPVIRGFEPPPDPYGPGHRGIDIGAPFGSDMVAAQDGTVAFAGWVGGSLFISIDHDDGVRTTYSWLSGISVAKGDVVARQQSIGQTGQGHPGAITPHLHFGARVGDTYIDPMLLLVPGAVAGFIHLAPLVGGNPEAFPEPWPASSVPPGDQWTATRAPAPRMSGLERGKAHPRPPIAAQEATAPAHEGGRNGAGSARGAVGCFGLRRLGRTSELAHASGGSRASGRCVWSG